MRGSRLQDVNIGVVRRILRTISARRNYGIRNFISVVIGASAPNEILILQPRYAMRFIRVCVFFGSACVATLWCTSLSCGISFTSASGVWAIAHGRLHRIQYEGLLSHREYFVANYTDGSGWAVATFEPMGSWSLRSRLGFVGVARMKPSRDYGIRNFISVVIGASAPNEILILQPRYAMRFIRVCVFFGSACVATLWCTSLSCGISFTSASGVWAIAHGRLHRIQYEGLLSHREYFVANYTDGSGWAVATFEPMGSWSLRSRLGFVGVARMKSQTYRFDHAIITQTGTVIPLWMPFVTLATPLILFYAFSLFRRKAVGCCRNCGYDLRGNVSGKCPECGGPCRANGQEKGPRKKVPS